VVPDGARAEAEQARDGRVVVAARDQVQDVELARRERGEVGTGCAGGLGPWGLDVATERAGRPGRLTDRPGRLKGRRRAASSVHTSRRRGQAGQQRADALVVGDDQVDAQGSLDAGRESEEQTQEPGGVERRSRVTARRRGPPDPGPVRRAGYARAGPAAAPGLRARSLLTPHGGWPLPTAPCPPARP